jgi:hypothetical protein
LVGKWLLISNEGWGMNCPSVESSDLTTARNIVPHTTSSKGEKVGRVWDQREDAREGMKENSRKIQSE